jgi:integrating conjugative element protein (TIGR03761 family)
VWLTLQTPQAQKLIHGREATPDKHPIVGLIGFADRLRVIWQTARQDDPYADWWLIQVHEAITAIASALDQQQAQLIEQLEAMSSLAISVAASKRPCRVRLRFANPYAYRAAQLLGAFDHVVCTAMTARHVGVLNGAACKALQQTGARKLRALFVLPRRYRCLKIDRAAVCAETGNARLARQVMGELPADILCGERLPPLLPRPVNPPTLLPEPNHLDGKNPDGT